METLTSLAHVSLAGGDTAQALSQIEEVLGFLGTSTLEGTDEPLQVYLTCYRVLRANRDQRPAGLLATAHRLLQDRARQIGDAQTRRSYLENVSAHREIVKEWKLHTCRPWSILPLS